MKNLNSSLCKATPTLCREFSLIPPFKEQEKNRFQREGSDSEEGRQDSWGRAGLCQPELPNNTKGGALGTLQGIGGNLHLLGKHLFPGAPWSMDSETDMWLSCEVSPTNPNFFWARLHQPDTLSRSDSQPWAPQNMRLKVSPDNRETETLKSLSKTWGQAKGKTEQNSISPQTTSCYKVTNCQPPFSLASGLTVTSQSLPLSSVSEIAVGPDPRLLQHAVQGKDMCPSLLCETAHKKRLLPILPPLSVSETPQVFLLKQANPNFSGHNYLLKHELWGEVARTKSSFECKDHYNLSFTSTVLPALGSPAAGFPESSWPQPCTDDNPLPHLLPMPSQTQSWLPLWEGEVDMLALKCRACLCVFLISASYMALLFFNFKTSIATYFNSSKYVR